MTDTQRYNVLLVGTDDAGGPDEAAAKLVERFRLSERVAAKLVRRLPAKVKKSVDRRQAEKYAKALRGLGMTVAVAELGTTGDYEVSLPSRETGAQDAQPQPRVQDVMRDIPSSLGVAPDTGFNSEIEAFLRGTHKAEGAGGPSFSLPDQLGDSPPGRPAKVIEPTMPMVSDPSLDEAKGGGGDSFADQFSGALDPALHADPAEALVEHEENAAVDDLFGVRASPLDEMAYIDDAPDPVMPGGTRAMSPVDAFGPRAGAPDGGGRAAGPGASTPRKTVVEAPATDWIERDHSFQTDAVKPEVAAFVTADREAALEDTLAELSGANNAVKSPTTTEFEAVSERMESTLSLEESTLSLDESALPKTSRNAGVGPTTSSLRSYRNTDSFRPPPPKSNLPTVLGVVAFLVVVGTGAFFGQRHWVSLQPPARFAAAEERFVLREVVDASVLSSTCAAGGDGEYLCQYDRAFFLNRFPEALVPAVEKAAEGCVSSLRSTSHGSSEELTCRIRLERGESGQIHRFDYHRNMSCEAPLTTLEAGQSTRCRTDTETAHFVDGEVSFDSQERRSAHYAFLRELELTTGAGRLSMREFDVTQEDDGSLERAFYSTRHGIIVRRRGMSGRAIIDIESLVADTPLDVVEGSADE